MSSRSSSTYNGFTPAVEEEIRDLAKNIQPQCSGSTSENNLYRFMSHESQVHGENPVTSTDERLDPSSDNFDSRFWVKNLRKLVDSDEDYFKPASLGVAYKNLSVFGHSTDSDYQATFANVVWKAAVHWIKGHNKAYRAAIRFDILKPMDGLINPGELTVVLGRPGAGCSTFLKTLATQTHGVNVDENSTISYDGYSQHDVSHHFRGDVVYCAEVESHFPHMLVGDTLQFAAKLRTPKNRPMGISREEYSRHMAEVAMATYGLSHTKNTKVGNDFVRGVSGGERKRVSIAEVYLSQASLQCWDNSTRGLDSATAMEFIRALKTSATICNATPLVAIYQCSQDTYDLFDKVVLLYEGYQIFFGSTASAKEYFVKMGWHCPQRQTTADFLTSLTNPSQREPQYGFEDKVPRTPKEFYEIWQKSPERAALLGEIDEYLASEEVNARALRFKEHHLATQTSRTRAKSSYTVSFDMQVKYIMQRNWLRLKGDPSVTVSNVVCNIIVSVLIATIFNHLKFDTESFYSRTAVLFFAVLFNAFCSLLEVFSLYEARPVVEKHKKFALYRPAADALASIITELPPKIITSIGFNLILYFVVHLRQSAGHFFFYWLINFTCTLAMSHIFRSIGSATTSLQQAMTPASLLLFTLIVFTGFVIPPNSMHGWCRWINYIDPVAYAFESLITNEFHGRDFPCASLVPRGGNYPRSGNSVVCGVVGAIPGRSTVSGDDYIGLSFEYYNTHKWRNWGILLAYTIFFLGVYITLVEYNKGAMQNGEILVFQHKALKQERKRRRDLEEGNDERIAPDEKFYDARDARDSENSQTSSDAKLPVSNEILHWRNLRYEVKIKTEQRIILNNVDGWVRPGQVTALMGASGAGKTTLLNTLSDRLTSGIITNGVRMVNGKALDSSFQRSIGYVQQQDLHLQTSTVREALKFSAYLRQPSSVTKAEKDDYVDYIISLLEMERYADAVVGVPGEGLNVEQRKRLTIGVELVAKPQLLLFLDEPTSGLDSETAWSICKLIRKLADHGQAILCTIHQPSAILMKEFDRLLFLQKGGQTVYFGDLGHNCSTLIDYFEKYGASKCPPHANPAEWMLEVIGAAPGSHADQDYYDVWLKSDEYAQVQKELDDMEKELVKLPKDDDPDRHKSYAAPYLAQYLLVTKRVFEQCWRTPSYTLSKAVLAVSTALFNGFAFFNADKTLQGLQNQMFSVFMFFLVFITLSHQYLPHFVAQRSLYEARERPSKTFSWFAFICAQITGEIPWNIICGTAAFFCWYYPIGLYHNATETNTVNERGATMWFTIVLFYIYTSSMAQLCISFIELAENAANLSIFLFTACLNFCGVLVSKSQMPQFWLFMYRFNPFTYLVSVVLSVGLAHSSVECSESELLHFDPPEGLTCEQYMAPYMAKAGGYLTVENARCVYCKMRDTGPFLKSINADYHTRWRDIGVFIGFIVFDFVLTIGFYWLARIPKGSRQKKQ
ncbi:uncharacterized protein CXQ87_004879 [Candidozyma duobushaemuli]|uniref:ABC transporter domain-containing protein n=1 Tax=Candidozyma duobushaemuli TaxID=1231522 RepID=A0A2V1AGA3_9ASCO|nr:uncharacterized protein CXQ87_004879 [[Candida] duobushaemulonis]PVH16584.1 hypothetical protein CXQ87_004879 [[Candida] duobushaemulonis]